MKTNYSNEKTCKNCKYFYQHYIKEEGKITQIYEGHCIYPRLKKRKIDDHCEHFTRRDDMEYKTTLLCDCLKKQLQQAQANIEHINFEALEYSENEVKEWMMKFINIKDLLENIQQTNDEEAIGR